MPDTPLLEPLKAFARWILSGACKIIDRESGELTSLVPTHVQRQLLAALLEQARAGLPLRVIVPKFRRGGVSTFIQALMWFLCGSGPSREALVMAHNGDEVKKIFRIARRIHNGAGNPGGDPSTTQIEFPNGSFFDCRTGGGSGAGRGAGLVYLLITELAYLQSQTGLDDRAITGLLNSVPDSPHTLVCVEGTGQGPTGAFHRLCQEAKRGDGPFKLVFLPWWGDQRNRRTPVANFAPTPAEEVMRKAYKLTDAQLTWRRMKRSQHPDDPTFKREYPASLDECFEVAKGRVYPTFSSAPVEAGGHVGIIEIKPGWERFRVIDWGWTENHPFVCLWVAHDPKHPPRLVIHPDCSTKDATRPMLVEEMVQYARDERTGEPVKDLDHGPDCVRMLAVTKRLPGLVYVYRALYLFEAATIGPAGAVREIHRLSGREVLDRDGADDLFQYEHGTGEQFAMTIADRSQPMLIEQCARWGLRPIMGHEKPIKETTGKGEVEDGIAHVASLIIGDAQFFTIFKSEADRVKEKLGSDPHTNIVLSRDEERILKEQREQERPHSQPADSMNEVMNL